MKTTIPILLALCTMATTRSLGQAPPAPPPPPPIANAPAPGAPPPPPDTSRLAPPPPAPGAPPVPADAPGATLESSVRQYLLNPDGEIDGLLLAEGTQVKFPPHLSAQVTQAIKPGDNIRVMGWRETGQTFTARTLQNIANGASVVDAPPTAPPAEPAAPGGRRPLESNGKVSAVLHSPRGEPDGAVLDNGTVLRMPPHVAQQLAGLLQPGSALNVRGFGTESTLGRCIEVTEIGPQGQTPTAIYTAPVPAPRPGR